MSDSTNGFEHLHKGAEIIVMFTIGEGKPVVCANGVPIEYNDAALLSDNGRVTFDLRTGNEAVTMSHLVMRPDIDPELYRLRAENEELRERVLRTEEART